MIIILSQLSATYLLQLFCYRRWMEEGVIMEKQNIDRGGKKLKEQMSKQGPFLWGRSKPTSNPKSFTRQIL